MMEKRASERPSMMEQLGEVRAKYQPNFNGVICLSLLLLMLGAGLLIYCQFQKPSRAVLMLGGLMSATAGLALLVLRAPYFGQALEVRAYGVRFVAGKDEIALFWEQVVHIDMQESQVRPFHVLPARRQWRISIHGCKGDVIHLAPDFLRHLPKLSPLLATLRRYAPERED